MLKILVAVFMGFLLPFAANAVSRQGFSFKAGVGYDFLSQKYFVDSLKVTGVDSVLTRWSLTSEYLNDLKGRFEATFRHGPKDEFLLRSQYEQTPDIIKLKLNSDWRIKTFLGDLRWRNQIDWRDQYTRNESNLGSYVSGSTVAKLRRPVSFNTTLWGQFQGDITNFYGRSSMGYDHYRIGGKAGIEQALGLLSVASLDGFYLARQVADSQTLDYTSFGLEGSFSGTTERLDVDLFTRWESKDYNRPEGDNDYNRFEADLLGRLALSQKFFTRQRFEAEITGYEPTDLLNNDYRRFRLTLLGGMQFDGMELGVGPDFQLLRESAEDTSFAEDYLETAGLVDFSYLSTQSIFASLETRLGYRQLEFDNEYQSDFIFLELFLIVDWTVLKRVNLNLLLSSDWEWHDDTSADNRVVLFSTGLTYAF